MPDPRQEVLDIISNMSKEIKRLKELPISGRAALIELDFLHEELEDLHLQAINATR